jgi:transcriptional regulator with XRE-family HTH domain
MINANKIRARIVELGLTQKQVAEMIGISEKTFSVKMNNGKFGLDEADKMIEVLKIDKPEKYFFKDVVA